MKKIEIDIDELIKIYSSGKSIQECAKIFNTNQSVIARRLKKANISIRQSSEYIKNPNISKESIEELYINQKLSLDQTAKTLNVSQSGLRKMMKRFDIATRSISNGSKIRKGTIDIKDEEIIRLYKEEGWSCLRISMFYGKSIDFARQRLIKLGIVRRSSNSLNKERSKITDDIKQKIFIDHMKGLSINDMKIKYNIAMSYIYIVLNDMGFKPRNHKDFVIKSDARKNIEDVINMYQNHISVNDISEKFGCTDTVIYNILRENNIEMRDCRGENNWNWKGGVSGIQVMIRTCCKYKEWRRKIMERDNYTCQVSGVRGGELEVHHCPRSFAELIQDFLSLYPELDILKDVDKLSCLAQDYEPFWDINNGITLSKEEHRKTKEIQLDLDEIYDLYINKELSAEQIGRINQCSGDTIINRLERMGIKRD